MLGRPARIHPRTLGCSLLEGLATVEPVASAAATRSRARADIVRIVHHGTSLADLTRAISHSLRRAVRFDGTCLLTVDPATLLPTGEIVENGLPPWARVRLTEIELGEPDYNKFRVLARAGIPAASLSAATDGDLGRSVRQRDVRGPNGFGDELRVVLTGPTGCWGTLTLLRGADRPDFSAADVRFVASLADTVANGVRRATLLTDTTPSDGATTGLLVLAPDDSIELSNQGAQQWIAELSPPDASALPVAIRAVAIQTRRVAAGEADAHASARVHTRTGRWAIVRGSLVSGDRVAILLEAARPAELATAIADMYGLTDRERAVTALVARGFATKEISARLHLSTYTVQDHLKTIFDKTGTSSRGELVARLFVDHFLPRLDEHPSR